MLRTSGNRGADKMDVLTPVRAEECQPVASNDFLDLLWRTAKDELALVLGCAGEFILRCSPKEIDRKSTRLNSSHGSISYAVFCLQSASTRRYTLSLHDALPISPDER